MQPIATRPYPFEDRLLRKQLELLSQNVGGALLSSALTAFLFVYILFQPEHAALFIGWGIFSIILIAVRYRWHHYYYQRRDAAQYHHSWLRLHYTGTLLTGLTWGFAGIFLLPADPLDLSIMIIIFCGTAAATAASYSAIRGMSACISIPSLLPFGLRLISLGDEQHVLIGIIILLFMLIMLIAAESAHRETINSLKLSFENLDLAHAATLAREETQKLNSELLDGIAIRRLAEQRTEASERELFRILENMQDTYYRTDVAGRITRVSSSVKSLLEYEVEELIGTSMADHYHDPHERDRFLAALQAANGRITNYTACLRTKSGANIWVATNAQYLHNEYGAVIGVEGTTRDITALKHTERALYDEKEKAEVTLRSIGDGVITTDVQGMIDYMNPVAETLTGWTRAKAYGKHLNEVITLTKDSDPQESKVTVATENILRAYDGDLLLKNRARNRDYAVEITTSDLKDADGNCRGAVMVFHDVTKLRGMAREMSYQATHDSLTGLINRMEFEGRLEAALHSAQIDADIRHAMLYMDLDQFKVVNDTCGHIAGDELLRQLTAELRTHIRGSDVLARLGGDEFGVLLENCPVEKARSIAEELRNAVQNFRFIWQQKVFEIGVSIGLVEITDGSGDITGILSAADSACYVAKDLGRNRVHTFHIEDEELTLRHGQMQWIQRIKQALEQNRFELFAQTVKPISKNGGGNYHEVLMRLIDEDGRLVSPLDFIPAAERYHLMTAIDRWVVHAALTHYGRTGRLRYNEIVAINLSGQSLADEGFLEYIVSQIRSSGIPAGSICLEITETAAIANLARAIQFMNTLRDMGCRFALDDFGSGLSSFGYLQRLPVDFLKIDGAFIRDILTHPIHYAMVESINHIGHMFGMKTIAEFVENHDILAKLRGMNVDYAQGYGIERPVPLHITQQSGKNSTE